jgi:heat-inducible transcriptional repressor
MIYIIGVPISTLPTQVLKIDRIEVKNLEDPRLTPRKVQILKAIVDAHISHGEPVGSKYLSQGTELTCSPATIRNEMAELEDMGYLIQPHTSSGRIPSELGYRLYVDALVRQYGEAKSEIEEINEKLKYKLTEMDQILSEASKLAASFTDYTGIAFKSGANKVRISRFNSVFLGPRDFLLVMSFSGDIVKSKSIHLGFTVNDAVLERFTEALNIYLVNLSAEEISMPLIMKLEAIMGAYGAMVHPAMKVIYEAMKELDARDVKLDGITKLLQYPEYSDVNKLRSLLGVLEEKDKLMDVISAHNTEDDGIHVYIGTEDDSDVMQNTTLIFRNVKIGQNQLAVGVIGPKRMNYSKVIDMINGLASGIDRMFGEGESDKGLPPGYDE